MNLLVFADVFGIGKAIQNTWLSIWLSLNNAIYSIIEVLYKVFMSVAEVNLFSGEAFEKITGRIYVVIGIAMLFIFAYNLILMIINPDDKKSTGQMTKIIKETIISLVLIVLMPFIFNSLSTFQKHLLSSNIIGQIIIGDTGGSYQQDCEKYSNNNVLLQNDITAEQLTELKNQCITYNSQDAKYRGAASVAPTIFSAFYHPSEYGYFECSQFVEVCSNSSNNSCVVGSITDSEDKKLCAHYYYDVELSKFSGSLKPFGDSVLLDKVVDPNDETFEFNYLLAFLAGCFAFYMFLCYTLSIGVRVAKLGFLQIVSPIATIMRIIPKKKEAIFDKWLKNVIDTYLDVFIRLAIIYFAMFAISLIPDVINTLFTSFESLYTVRLLSIVVVILGVLMFAQEAPKLLKEFIGNGGSFAIKSPKKQLGENKLAIGGVNALRGGIYGATTGKGVAGKLGGFVSGAGRGAVGGYDKAVKGLDTARTERENGSTFWGRQLDRTRTAIGMETRAEADDRNIEKVFNTTERQKQNEAVMKQIKNIKSHVEEKIERENSKVKFHVADANGNIIEGNYNSMSQYLKSLQDNISNATNDADRAKALKEMDIFRDNLGQQKKQAVENMVHSLMNGSRVQVDTDSNGNPVYAFNENDMSLVQTSVAEINKEISKGGVGLQFDDQGNAISGSETTESITSGFDLLNSFKDSIEAQSYEIQQHSSTVNSNYTARHADSRMVRGNGKSEKK